MYVLCLLLQWEKVVTKIVLCVALMCLGERRGEGGGAGGGRGRP